MSTWYKVSVNGDLHGRLELPDEFEQYIRRLEAERDEALRDRDEFVVMVKKAQEERDYNENTAMNNAQAAVYWMDKSTKLEVERDEARKKLDNVRECWGVTDEIVWDVMTSWDGDGVQPGPEIVELKKQRDEARRWAIHYRRLYEALSFAPVTVTVFGVAGEQINAFDLVAWNPADGKIYRAKFDAVDAANEYADATNQFAEADAGALPIIKPFLPDEQHITRQSKRSKGAK